MLLATASGLGSLSSAIQEFLGASSLAANFAAETDGDPAPYDEFLPGLRVIKGSGQKLTIAGNKWLELEASPNHLVAFCDLLRHPKDGQHVHLSASPECLIVEEGQWPAA